MSIMSVNTRGIRQKLGASKTTQCSFSSNARLKITRKKMEMASGDEYLSPCDICNDHRYSEDTKNGTETMMQFVPVVMRAFKVSEEQAREKLEESAQYVAIKVWHWF